MGNKLVIGQKYHSRGLQNLGSVDQSPNGSRGENILEIDKKTKKSIYQNVNLFI